MKENIGFRIRLWLPSFRQVKISSAEKDSLVSRTEPDILHQNTASEGRRISASVGLWKLLFVSLAAEVLSVDESRIEEKRE